MKNVWLFAVVVLFGCGVDRVSKLQENFFVEQPRVELGRVWVGHERTVSVPVESRSRYDLKLVMGERELTVPAGSTARFELTVMRAEPGTFEQRVLISGERQTIEVIIAGDAAVIPECIPSGPCVESSFDFEAGACVAVNRAEMTACGGESACVLNGHCEAGQCVGAAVSCDDGNACTNDACAVGSGCVHVDSSSACELPAPSCTDTGKCLDPCVAAYCDPVSGCQTTPLADGTSCGPSDCATAHVCISGACEVRAVPEGASCGADSPCQGKGQCVQGACQRPAATALPTAWTYASAPGMRLRTDLTIDGQGQLVFAECGDDLCDLVSVSANGVLRYRVPMTGVLGVRSLSLGNGRVFLATAQGEVRIHDGATGARLATVDVLSLIRTQLTPMSGAATTTAELPALAADGAGRIYVLARARSTSGDAVYDRGSFLLALNDASGALFWKRGAKHHTRLVVSETLDVFTTEWTGTTSDTAWLLALKPDGTLRYAVASSDTPLAAQGGQLLTSYGFVHNALTGAQGVNTGLGGSGGYDWIAARGNSAWTVDFAECFPSAPAVKRASTSTGAQLFRTVVDTSLDSYAVTGPLLTQRDSVLVTVARSSQYFLAEVNANGELGLNCELADTRGPYGAVLGDDRYFVSDYLSGGVIDAYMIKAYDVPGRRPAVSGWVGPGGGPAHSSRPR